MAHEDGRNDEGNSGLLCSRARVESVGLSKATLRVRTLLLLLLLLLLRRCAECLLVVLSLLLLITALAALRGVLVARGSPSLTLLSLVVTTATTTVALLVVLTTLLRLLLQLRGTSDRTRDVLGSVIDIQALVNVLRNGLDLSAQLLLDSVQVEAVLPVDQVNSQTQVTETTRTTDTVKISLSVLREIEVDDNVDSLNIDTTTCRQLVHEVDLVRVLHVLVLEFLNNDRESGREEHDLAVRRVE
ncbi:hypothetical protein KCV07_g202, partial [Aureobasidium melanogenum]